MSDSSNPQTSSPSPASESSFAPSSEPISNNEELKLNDQQLETPIFQSNPIAEPSAAIAPKLSPTLPPSEPIAPEPPNASSATNLLMAMLVGALLACALFGGGILVGRSSNPGGNDVLAASPVGTSGSSVSANSGNAIVRAVAAVGPAVMNVDTTFGKTDGNFLPLPGQMGPREGKGTGFVIDTKKGWMLTNAHVVAGAQKIQVTTRDGDKWTGRVLGFDRQSDIAVVELSNKKLPQAKLATFKDAKELPIGDWAIAIGNPFAQENTVTVGVLSAVGRTLPVPANEDGEAFQLTDMMQTDAAINPGNSGGPLCNLRGEVIGINTAIIPFGQGLGFTIPINKAKEIADQIIKNGKVLHPYIGVVVTPVTDALQSDYGLPDKVGGLVRSVKPGSPAAKSGLQIGDVIRKIDGQVMKDNDDVVRQIGKKKVGDVVKIEILRNNSVKRTLTLKVGDRPN
jgi:serine protease Do